MKLHALLLLCVGTAAATTLLKDKMTPVFAWKYMDYVFPSADIRQELIASQQFIFQRNMPVGFEVWRDKFFLTTPRRKAGVPVALGYVKLNENDMSPLVIPYPDYETNKLPKQGEPDDGKVHIASAYRIKVDACDRLWVMDTGLADIGLGHKPFSRPQILIYDLLTDRLIRRYQLRDSDFTPASFFATINVESSPKDCEDVFAYVADLGANGLLVYSFRDNYSWRVKHSYFYADPLAANFEFEGNAFQLIDGAITATVSNVKEDGFRLLYFHALSSFREFAVSTKILHDETLAAGNHLAYRDLGTRGFNAQSSASVFDEKTGVLFFTEVQNHAVTCWNSFTFSNMTGNIDIMVQDKETKAFTYPCDIKLDKDDNLWVLSNNIPRYVKGDLNPDIVNHYIFKAPKEKMLEGTKCHPSYKLPKNMDRSGDRAGPPPRFTGPHGGQDGWGHHHFP